MTLHTQQQHTDYDADTDTVTDTKTDEDEQRQEQMKTHQHHQQDEYEEEEEESEDHEKHTTRVTATATDSPPSTFSLSPQSNRSYKTPSPAADFGAYFDWVGADRPNTGPSSLAQPNRSYPAEPLVLTKSLDPEARDGFVLEPIADDGDEGGRREGLGSFNRRKLKPDLTERKKAATAAAARSTMSSHGVAKRVLLGFRVCGLVLCLASFSIMAANRDQGWALDSFYRYKEFRYCLVVNVLGFVCSGYHVFDLIHFVNTEKHIIQHGFHYYSDFFIDQALAYLLMSASSSAATRVDDWQSNWGKDKFPDMARTSVGFSFAAFVALAWCSIISGYILCTAKAL